jgi:hypothetical protein
VEHKPLVWESAEPTTVPVKIGKVCYTLREAFADEAKRHKAKQMSSMQVNQAGSTSGFEGVAQADLDLLGECLLYTEDSNYDGKGQNKVVLAGRPVGISLVSQWPDRITRPLIDRLKEISGIGQETKEQITKQINMLQAKLRTFDEDTAKNSPSAGTTSSGSATS